MAIKSLDIPRRASTNKTMFVDTRMAMIDYDHDNSSSSFKVPENLGERYRDTHGGSIDAISNKLVEYKAFMEERLGNDHLLLPRNSMADGSSQSVLIPTTEILQMWHLHILDIKHYDHACNAFLGRRKQVALDLETLAVTVERQNRIELLSLYGDARHSAKENLVNGPGKRPNQNHRMEETMMIRILDPMGEVSRFKARRSTPLGRLFQTFGRRQGIQPASLVFQLFGERIASHETPFSLQMEEGDWIHCLFDEDSKAY